MNTTSLENAPAHRPIVSLGKFRQEAGISSVTAWRWRRKGWLLTINIAGRQYITGEALAEFQRRALAEWRVVKAVARKNHWAFGAFYGAKWA